LKAGGQGAILCHRPRVSYPIVSRMGQKGNLVSRQLKHSYKATGELSEPGKALWHFWVKFRVHDPDTSLEYGLTYQEAWAALKKYQRQTDETGNRYAYQYGIRSENSPNWEKGA